jgi:multiple sugar transport system substrate-binding protein
VLGAGAPLAAIPLLAACGAGEQAAKAPATGGPPAEVVFMRTANASLQRAYEAQAEAFNKKQDRIRGRFEPAAVAQGETWLAKLTTMLASDAAPDCFLVSQEILPNVAGTGSLLVLDSPIKRDAREVDANDFFPSHLAGGKWRSRQVALTPDGCAILEYYNISLFQQAGVPVPQPAWTWTEYLDAARRLTRNDGGTVIQSGIEGGFTGTNLLPWLWSNSGDIFSDDFKQVRVAERTVVQAVQFVVDLVQRHGVTSASPGVSLGPNPHVNGKAAMWRANRGFFGNLAEVTSFKFNVVPLARAPQGSSVTHTTPGHIAIAQGNKQPDVAWEWLKFLTSREAQVIRSQVQQGGCPSRKSATQDPSYKDLSIPALESTSANKTFADVLADPKSARFLPSYVAMPDANAILNKHVQAAIKGEQSVAAAMESARRELEDLLRRQPQPQGN